MHTQQFSGCYGLVKHKMDPCNLKTNVEDERNKRKEMTARSRFFFSQLYVKEKLAIILSSVKNHQGRTLGTAPPVMKTWSEKKSSPLRRHSSWSPPLLKCIIKHTTPPKDTPTS